MMKAKLFSALLVATMTLPQAQAKLVQILHTNDTHSFLDGATHKSNVGGSARLKSLIDYHKNLAAKDGVKSLVLDAGDFLEGNLYYMAEEGMKSFEVHNSVGYQAVALGNHDYLMGAQELDKMLGNIDLKFSLLAANVWVSPKFQNIRDKIKPYKEVEIDGIKVGILGLTTNEFYYSWRLEDSQITDPYKAAVEYEEILKKRNNDYIIALTHLGVGKDKKLARKSSNIDLIVGGHSHTVLKNALYEKNKNFKMVPIVQAGQHIEYLGKIVVDMEKGKPLKMVSYELIPVTNETQDKNVKRIVAGADEALNDTFGEDWLNEKIGHSDLKPDDHSGSRKWAYFISDALREKAQTDIAIHAPPMNGENYPVGDITRKSILNSIPRVFELDNKEGWSIYTAKIKGVWIKLVFETLATFGEPLAYSGIKMKIHKTPFGLKIGRAYINGKTINPFKDYTVAFTEGIIRGAIEISPKTQLLLKSPVETPFKIWQTLQEKVIRDGNQLKSREISEDNRTFFYPEKDEE